MPLGNYKWLGLPEAQDMYGKVMEMMLARESLKMKNGKVYEKKTKLVKD